VNAALDATRDVTKTEEQLGLAWQNFDKTVAEDVALIMAVKPAVITAVGKKVKGLTGDYDLTEYKPEAMGPLSISK